MSGKLARLSVHPEPPSAASERRREPRHAVKAQGYVQSGRGERVDVSVVDVSSHGCAVQIEAAWLRSGSFVSVGIGEQPPLQAIIRWVRSGGAGMEFLGAIPSGRIDWHDLMDDPFA